MPHPHNHKELTACRAKYNADWKESQQAKKKRTIESDADVPPKKSAGGNLSLAKSFKYTLSTQEILSDQEAKQLVDDVLNGKFNKDYELR